LRDDFRQNALLDLRPLNEKVAGQSGYVTVDPQGAFRLGSGEIARFWGVNSNVRDDQASTRLATHARFLSKRGVNMVRCFFSVFPDLGKHPDAKFGDEIQKTATFVGGPSPR